MGTRLIELLARAASADLSSYEEFKGETTAGLVDLLRRSGHDDQGGQQIIAAVYGQFLRTIYSSDPRKLKDSPEKTYVDDARVVSALRRIAASLSEDLPMRKLVQRIAKGDNAAFNKLYGIFVSKLESFVQRRQADEDLASEIVQDTMVFVFLNAGRFKGESKVSTWLYGIARMKSLEAVPDHSIIEIRDESNGQDETSELGSQSAPESDWHPMDLKKVGACLDKLPPDERQCIHLWLNRESYRDIAEILNKPEHWVGRTVFNANRKIAKCLRAQRPPAEE